MKFKWPKIIDYSTIVQVIGLSLVSYGLFLVFPALSFIALGSFLVYITEKE